MNDVIIYGTGEDEGEGRLIIIEYWIQQGIINIINI